MIEDTRPKEYKYFDQLMKHLDNDESIFFSDKFIYPRQFEIHLPANHKTHCNLSCPICAGKYFIKDLDNWELEGLQLLHNLKGAIPYHIYGGSYTEPILNPYYLTYLATTKLYGNHFGIHTNGTLLNWLEDNQGWLTELNRLSTDKEDYLSISIDAGLPHSWAKTKGTKKEHLFFEIIDGLEKACRIRGKKSNGHAIRLCYLISPESGNIENFTYIISVAKDLKVDSLRFSIPFAPYNQDFERVRRYKKNIEIPGNIKYKKLLDPYLSKSQDEIPYIFFTDTWYTDINRFTFNKCFYSFYQITAGADGFMYMCSTVSTPTAKHCRLGRLTSNLDEFKKIIQRSQNGKWNCEKMCFSHGLRGNRMACEINEKVNELIR